MSFRHVARRRTVALGGAFGTRVEEGAMHEVQLVMLSTTSQDDEEVLTWQERSLCAQTDPEAFFPEKGGSTREAKRVCLGCDVRSECLEYALGHDERFGIWGGLSERERRRLKKAAV
jgi:WhiB family redox-sensing transcriptional regulator